MIERTCETCPVRLLNIERLNLNSDVIQFCAARQAAHHAISANTHETPFEAAHSLTQHRLDEDIDGRQGTYEIIRDDDLILTGILCAKKQISGDCALPELTWHRATAEGNPLGVF